MRMKLTDADIASFIQEWKAEFGETLPSEVARAEAMRLVEFFAALRKAAPSPDGTEKPGRDTMPA